VGPSGEKSTMPDRKTAKASINFKPLKPGSISHNERTTEFDYVRKSLSSRNESWKGDEIPLRLKAIEDYCKSKSGRKLQKNAAPIREAVVKLHEHHDLKNLTELARELQENKKLRCFQIHIHRDEGRWEDPESGETLPTKNADQQPSNDAIWVPNYHAHMLFDWQDLDTGKVRRINKVDLSQIQTLTAKVLGMERGELRVNSNRERLEAIEYKKSQELKALKRIEAEIEKMESKKKSLPVELQKLEKHLKNSEEEISKEINYQPSWQIEELKTKYHRLTDEQLKQLLNSNLKRLRNLERGKGRGIV